MEQFNRSMYRRLIGDCFTPKLGIYWRDFLITYAFFLGGAALLLAGPSFLLRAIGYFVTVFSAYRAASYIHEIVHLPKGPFKSFIWGWNILIGVPFLMPSILYETHLDHHIPRKYATKEDPEYLYLADKGLKGALGFIVHHAFLTPVILYIRLLLGLPARLLSPKLAQYFERYFSALVINWHYARPKINRRLLILLEAFVLVTAISGSFLMQLGLFNPLSILPLVGAIIGALVLNAIRTLAAHRYANESLRPVDAQTQLLDSLNHTGSRVIGFFMAPVGLRFHALHHLFPTIPYHDLERAHNRLVAALAPEDVYHKSSFTSFTAQFFKLIRGKECGLLTEAKDPAKNSA